METRTTAAGVVDRLFAALQAHDITTVVAERAATIRLYWDNVSIMNQLGPPPDRTEGSAR